MRGRPRNPARRGWVLLALALFTCAWLGRPRTPPAPPSDLAAALVADRELDVRWVSLEFRGLLGYRLTATVDGGSTSRLISGRTVDTTNGAPLDAQGKRRVYQVQLPVPNERRGRVRVILEALRLDGSSVPITAREFPLGAVGHDARRTVSPAGPDRVAAGEEALTPKAMAPRLAALDDGTPACAVPLACGTPSRRTAGGAASNTRDAANGRSPPI